MPVFRLYMKIIRSKTGLICLYIGIFLFLAILMSYVGKQTDPGNFQETSVSIAVADQDSSVLSKALIDYLDKRHDILPIANDKETMQDMLYYEDAQYVLIIPADFESSYIENATSDVSDGETLPTLENVKAPKSTTGYLVDTQLDEYLTNIRAYLASGESVEQAVDKAADLQEIEITTSFLSGTDSNASMTSIYYYLQYLPYIFISVTILIFGTALLSIYKPEVRKRNYCSATTLKSFNFQIGLGCLFMTGLILLLLLILGIILYRKELTGLPFMYIACNVLSFTTVSMSIGFLTGFMVKNENGISMLSNLFSLGFSFLGGIFVPQELLSPKILPFSKLLPSYWYVANNNMLFQNDSLSSTQIASLFKNCGLQVVFAFAVFAIALLLTKQRASAQ